MERHQDAVVALLCSRLRDRRAVEDLAQETLVEAYVGLGSLREAGRFRPWLIGIARHVAGRWLRRARTEAEALEGMMQEHAAPDPGPSPHEDAEARELADAVWAAVDELPESTREAVLLHYVGGLSDGDIARATGITASAARSRLHYGRQQLRARMLPFAEDVLARERRGRRLTRAVMAALPLSIPRPPPVAVLFGLTLKEVLMSVAGVALIAGLAGLAWARAQSLEAAEPQPTARVVRLASAEQRAALQIALAAETEGKTGMEAKHVRLDLEAQAPGGDFVGCLRPALQAVGVDWSLDDLRGFLGPAFAFSMKADGGHLNQADNHQWSYFWEMLSFLQVDVIDASLQRIPDGGGEPPPADPVALAAHTAAKEKAWDAVRRSLDAGRPAIVWQPMTKQARDSGRRPLPFLWGLIVGYDERAGTYTVHHSGQGEFSIGWDAFGHSDPVNWFCVMVVPPQTRPFDAPTAHRRAVERAVDISAGKFPGVNAPAQGLAAYEMWLRAFEDGTVSTHHIADHASFLIQARSAAAAYLRDVESTFPEDARPSLREAAARYDEEVGLLQQLRQLAVAEDVDLTAGGRLLARALKLEREAVARLQRALAAS